jgi:hypothetical protein
MRDLSGQPIFKSTVQEGTRYELDGVPTLFPDDGTMNPAVMLMISGQWDQLVWAMRQDMTFKVLSEGVIPGRWW